MDVTSYVEQGLVTHVETDELDRPYTSILFRVSDDRIRQFITWEQLEILRNQINDALGLRAEAKHKAICEASAQTTEVVKV
jgi:hypothetical protein